MMFMLVAARNMPWLGHTKVAKK